MVGNRGPVVEGHHSLTSYLPTITHNSPHFPDPSA